MTFNAHIDQWEGNTDKGTSFIADKDNIAKQLRLLDGKRHTQLLIISSSKNSSLLIGGGNRNLYVVTYTVGQDEDFYNLINPQRKGDEEIEIVTGGQAGMFPERYGVDFNAAADAAMFYIETGKRNPALIWELQE